MVGLAVGNHREAVEAQIDPASGPNRLRRRRGELGNAQRIPVARGGLLNGHTFDRAVLVSVVNPNPTELGNFDTGAFEHNVFSKAQFGRRAVTGLKAGELTTLLKKVLVGAVKVPKALLQAIGVHVIKPTVRLLVGSHLGGLLNVGQTFTRRLVSFFAPRQAPVVDVAAQATHIRQPSGLRSGRTKLDFQSSGMLIHGQVPQSPVPIITRPAHSKPYFAPLSPQFLRSAKAGGFLEGFL